MGSSLADVKALTDTGQWPAGLAKALPLVAAARATGYQSVLAETLAARAWLEYHSGETSRDPENTESSNCLSPGAPNRSIVRAEEEP